MLFKENGIGSEGIGAMRTWMGEDEVLLELELELEWWRLNSW